MSGLVEHNGVVERSQDGRVYVKITSASACGSCRARQVCGQAEAQQKIFEIPCAGAGSYRAGDAVRVGVRRRAALRAVLLAYVGALAVVLAVLFTTVGALGWSEGCGVMAALGGVGIYYGALWLLRRRIEQTIQFTITKM